MGRIRRRGVRGAACTVATVTALVAGCAAHPIDPGWDDLDATARDARAVEALAGLWAQGLDLDGVAVVDRGEVEADALGVTWRDVAPSPWGPGAARVAPGRAGVLAAGVAPTDSASTGALATDRAVLRWVDVEAVEWVRHPDEPAQPETLVVYLAPGAPSEATIPGLSRPTPLDGPGFGRARLVLTRRPPGARARAVAALMHLRDRAPPRPTSAPAPAEPVPSEPAPSERASAPTSATALEAAPTEPAPDPAAPPPLDDAALTALTDVPPGDVAAIEAALAALDRHLADGALTPARHAAARRNALARFAANPPE